LRYAFDRFIGTDPARIASFEEEQANADLAREIHDLRTDAGLTQKQPPIVSARPRR
jgi:hypothetical protein